MATARKSRRARAVGAVKAAVKLTRGRKARSALRAAVKRALKATPAAKPKKRSTARKTKSKRVIGGTHVVYCLPGRVPVVRKLRRSKKTKK